MNTLNDGGPAFPNVLPETTAAGGWDGGMSLRDWFAGQYQVMRDNDTGNILGFDDRALEAVTGIPLPPECKREVEPDKWTDQWADKWAARLRWEIQVEAVIKIMHADAMLAARARTLST